MKKNEQYLKVSSRRLGSLLSELGISHDEFVKKAVASLTYYEFLNTPYWEGVRQYKLKKAEYKCELCGKSGILNVHHKTYDRHGMEHVRSVADKDLIVLCKDCHRKFHEKLINNRKEN